MTGDPRISVLTPAYNAERYLAETIESILGQTFGDFEYVIADDCSTDGTLDVAREYARRDSRIRVCCNERNLGLASNRNRLLQEAKGEFVAWQDADDLSTPTRLERQLAFLESHPDVAVCGGFLQLFSEKGNLSLRRYPSDDVDLRKVVFRHTPVCGGASLIRRKCLDEVGDYDPRFSSADDLDMTLRLGARFKLGNVSEVVLKYRIHPQSMTSTTLDRMDALTFQIRKKHIGGQVYRRTPLDALYNAGHFLAARTLPPSLRLWLFRVLRDST